MPAKTTEQWLAEKEAASAAFEKNPTFENYMRCDHTTKMWAASLAGARR